MKIFNFIVLLFIAITGYSQQEWEDIKLHEGSGHNSNSANGNPDFKIGRFRNTKLRNQEKNSLGPSSNGAVPEESRKRLEKIKEEKARAIEDLRSRYFSQPDQRLIDCGTCSGTGLSPCSSCEAKGSQQCPFCRGISELDCRTCDGNGLVSDLPCVSCEGSGKKKCQFCRGTIVLCQECAGLGYSNCKDCHGASRTIVSRTPGDTTKIDELPFGIPISTESWQEIREKKKAKNPKNPD